MSSIFETGRARVNSSTMSTYCGKPVCLLGEVVQMDPSGQTVKLRTSDKQIVNVFMSVPVQDLLEGIVEVQGIVGPNNTIQAHSYNMFPKDSIKNFDMDLYNEAVLLMKLRPKHYVLK